jgi:hypothetical protein
MTAKKTVKSTKKNTGLKEPWKPGQSGNPNGRPKKEFCIPDILRKILKEDSPYSHPDDKRTVLDEICWKAALQAMGGDKDARAWISDRTEGKALERVRINDEKDELIIA